jgi:hypothetical protein
VCCAGELRRGGVDSGEVPASASEGESVGSASELRDEERRKVLDFYRGRVDRGALGRRKWWPVAINGGRRL